MAFGLYTLIEATILCLNAVCILHEERFLAKSEYPLWLYYVNIKLYIYSILIILLEGYTYNL